MQIFTLFSKKTLRLSNYPNHNEHIQKKKKMMQYQMHACIMILTHKREKEE